MNIAGFKLLDPKGIPNVGPLSAARQMLQDPIDNKFIGFSSYWDQVQVGVKYLAGRIRTPKRSLHHVYPLGLSAKRSPKVHRGCRRESLGLTFAGETTHKPDELDFVGSLTKLKSGGAAT